MELKLSGAVVVITGASSGIGEATALRIAKRKGTLVLASRKQEALERVARKCRDLGAKAIAVQTDVTSEEEVKSLADRALQSFGRIDVWINNAGVYMLARFENTPADAFRRVFETNFFGYVNGARAVIPQFRKQGHGTLINVSSVLGKLGSPLASAYASSKFAVTGFSECLRVEQRDIPDIHVCTILPATIDTPLFQHAANYTGREIQALPPVHRVEDVAKAIVRCIRKPEDEVYIGLPKPVAALARMAPGITSRVMASRVRKHFRNAPRPSSAGNLFESTPSYAEPGDRKKQAHPSRAKRLVGAFALFMGAVAAFGALMAFSHKPSGLKKQWSQLTNLVGAG
jgi:NAD(P)-dependent dehydrogenase (short-subunit alcohol dehydrogenase family)